MEKLRECPICGSFEDVAICTSVSGEYITCFHCGLTTTLFETDGDLLIYWNNREEPKHETVEQWEARTGKTYPDEAPVWAKNVSKTYRLYEWQIGRGLIYDAHKYVFVANHHGKPNSIGDR